MLIKTLGWFYLISMIFFENSLGWTDDQKVAARYQIELYSEDRQLGKTSGWAQPWVRWEQLGSSDRNISMLGLLGQSQPSSPSVFHLQRQPWALTRAACISRLSRPQFCVKAETVSETNKVEEGWG